MSKYLSCGNIMSDTVEDQNGVRGPFHMGGPAIFGLAGIRLWEDDCAMMTNVGFDWYDPYGKWLAENGIGSDHVSIHEDLQTSTCLIRHHVDGTYEWVPLQGIGHIQKMLFTPEQMTEAFLDDTRGVYMFLNPFPEYFYALDEAPQRKRFKLMWEFGMVRMGGEFNFDFVRYADMFSVNKAEAERLFKTEDESRIIDALRELPVEFVFYRVGRRGAYGITKEETYFCPSVDPAGRSVDPSGCGNCSTAAAMYGWCEGLGPDGATATACISAGYNAAQYGIWPKFTDDNRKKAEKIRNRILRDAVVRIR